MRIYSPQEDLMPLKDARQYLRGRGGRPPSLTTVLRWCRTGCQPRRDLPAVVLETVLISGSLLTSRAWIDEFEQRRNELHRRSKRLAEPEQTTRRNRRRATDRLDSLGAV